MSITWFALPLRSLAALGGSLAAGILLAGTVAPTFAARRGPYAFHGAGCLPLTGDLSPAAQAFRSGFLEGLASSSDSSFRWTWTWTDNASDPSAAQAWADTVPAAPKHDVLLAGLGPALDGFRPRTDSATWMLLGDGPARGGSTWNLWPTSARERRRLLDLLRDAPKPLAIAVAASGSWAEIVLDGLRDSLPGAIILPHDLDNSRWDEETKQILENRPGTILFWNRPHEASSLLSRRLAWPVFRNAKLFVPEGTAVPDSMRATTLSPVWQPSSPPDSLQCLRYREWGRATGRSLAEASRLMLRDSLRELRTALGRLRPTSQGVLADSTGWYPDLRVDSSYLNHNTVP